MTSSFGKNYREEVQDVNAGKVASPRGVAKGTHKITGSGKQDITIHDDSGAQSAARMAASLTKAAGVVGESYSRQKRRDEWFEGYAEAGTAEGAARVAEAKPTWDEMLFGANSQKLGAQARIMNDDLANLKMELNAHRETGEGERMDGPTYKAYVKAKQDEFLDKYQDENFKDEAALVFGREAQGLIRDQAKKYEAYDQTRSRTAAGDSITKALEVGKEDNLSGDPDRIADAQQRTDDTLQSVQADMTQEAFNTLLEQQIKVDLGNGSRTLYDIVQKNGMWDRMTPEQKDRADTMLAVRNAGHDRKTLLAMDSISAAVEAGDTPTVVATLESLEANGDPEVHSALVAKLGAPNDLILTARKNERTAQAKLLKGELDFNKFLYGAHTDMTQEKRDGFAVRALVEPAMEMLQQEAIQNLHAEGIDASRNPPVITAADARKWLMNNPDGWINQWAGMDAAIPGIKQIAHELVNFTENDSISNMEMGEFQSILNTLDMAEQRGYGYALSGLNQEMRSKVSFIREMYGQKGAQPADWAQSINNVRETQRKIRERQRLDIDKAPTRKESDEAIQNVTAKVNEVLGNSFWSDYPGKPDVAFYMNPEQEHDLDQALRANPGNIQYAVAQVSSQIIAESRRVGLGVVADGAKIEAAGLDAAGTTLNRFIEGLNADPVTRATLTAPPYYAPVEFDLLDGSSPMEMHPTKPGWMIINVRNNAGTYKAWPVKIPNSSDQILPTATERKLDALSGMVEDVSSTIAGAIVPGFKAHQNKESNNK